MAQHDYVIANGTGAAVRSDLNNALAAIVSQNSGATEPATMYAYQWWADTSTGLLKLRNGANNAWITLRELDGTLTIEAGTVSAPGLAFASDLNTGVWSPGADQFAIATNGVERVEWGTSEVVFNDGGTNYDFRVEGDTNANLLFVDASADAVGIGTSSPGQQMVVRGSQPFLEIRDSRTGNWSGEDVFSGILFGTDDTTTAVDPHAFIKAVHTRAGTGHSSADAGLTFGTSASTSTPATERMRIDDQGRVGIGTTSPSQDLDLRNTGASAVFQVLSGAALTTSTSTIQLVAFSSASAVAGTARINGTAPAGGQSELSFLTSPSGNAPTERVRIDSSGRLLVGTSTARSNFGTGTQSARLQIEGASGDTARIAQVQNANNANAIQYIFAKSRGTTVGSNTIVQSNDNIGILSFEGSDGTNFVPAAQITGAVDGTPGANDMPGRLVFSTTADGASSPTERMRIGNAGHTWFNSSDFTTLYPGEGNTATGFFVEANGKVAISRDNTNPLVLNRKTSDGTIVDIRQDGTSEGSISVSGTTVSYNGAHLSRWSQLPSGAKREEILRGSVLSNIDEMCEWGEEDNEQLNRMKVSDVEGDKNVSGVFQSWDDDDDTYTDDFYCAMTGDFIIRIAEGVTVERGDLLMSAGDGTAKPQDDDIIRSKTIAKVTSTTVSCTHPDGSYCVPCVLMAC